MLALTCLVLASGPVVLDEATVAKLKEIAFQAARDGDVTTLKEYFAVGQPVNAINARGDSLLIVAVYNGQAEAAQLILKQPKVDLAFRNKMGFTALDGAAFKGHVGLIRTLVKAGAEVNGRSPSGRTALMLSALTNRLEAARALIEAGARTDMADERGTTALKLAQLQGADDMVRLLQK